VKAIFGDHNLKARMMANSNFNKETSETPERQQPEPQQQETPSKLSDETVNEWMNALIEYFEITTEVPVAETGLSKNKKGQEYRFIKFEDECSFRIIKTNEEGIEGIQIQMWKKRPQSKKSYQAISFFIPGSGGNTDHPYNIQNVLGLLNKLKASQKPEKFQFPVAPFTKRIEQMIDSFDQCLRIGPFAVPASVMQDYLASLNK